ERPHMHAERSVLPPSLPRPPPATPFPYTTLFRSRRASQRIVDEAQGDHAERIRRDRQRLRLEHVAGAEALQQRERDQGGQARGEDRKSTRLNSSHDQISYAVFCLKKKKKHRV